MRGRRTEGRIACVWVPPASSGGLLEAGEGGGKQPQGGELQGGGSQWCWGAWKNSDRQPGSSPGGSLWERSEPLSLGLSQLVLDDPWECVVAEILDLEISLTRSVLALWRSEDL